MSDVRETVMPKTVRAAQLVLYALAFAGLVLILALSEDLTSYGLGVLLGPWLLVWVCALLAVTYDGGARLGVRRTTCLVLGFAVFGSVSALAKAAAPGEFLDAATRILLGVPVVVLLCLPESGDWFRRPK